MHAFSVVVVTKNLVISTKVMYYNPPALKHLVFSSWENIDMSCILSEA